MTALEEAQAFHPTCSFALAAPCLALVTLPPSPVHLTPTTMDSSSGDISQNKLPSISDLGRDISADVGSD